MFQVSKETPRDQTIGQHQRVGEGIHANTEERVQAMRKGKEGLIFAILCLDIGFFKTSEFASIYFNQIRLILALCSILQNPYP